VEIGVRLLGVPAVLVDGAWLPLRPGKVGALVAFVAHRGAVVRRGELAALLWPDADDRRAHTNLRQLLRTLAAGPWARVIDRDAAFVWSVVESDVAHFRRAVAEERWRDAAAIYRGPFLEGFDDAGLPDVGAWADGERFALAELWRHAALAAMAADEAAGLSAEVLALADRLVAADPLDEEAVAQAMRAALALGDRRAAHRRLAALTRALREEVGAEPAAETMALLDEVPRETRSPPDAAATTAQAAGSTGRSAPEILGREREIANLTDLLRSERLVTVLASGGLGKTALARAAADAVDGDFPGGLVFVPLDRDVEPRPLLEAVADAAGLVPGEGRALAAQLGAAWGDARVLLLLDGCERHVAEVEALDDLLRACPGVVVLVTSRTRLRHAREVVVPLDGLATADPGGLGGRGPSPAARLILREARRRQPPRWPVATPDAESLARVERIGAMLGGSPLAIELVASWLDVVPLEELERRVGEAWTFLRSEDAGRPPGQRDLEAVLDHVWHGLGLPERQAWARLAALGGSVDGALGARVGGGWRTIRLLADHAIVRQSADRLVMHALVARFGRERAAATADAEAAWSAALPALRERFATEVDPASGRALRHHDDTLALGVAVWRRAVAARDAVTIDGMAFGLLRALRGTVRLREAAALAAEAVAALETELGRHRDRALARVLPFAATERLERRRCANEALAIAERVDDDRARAHALDWIARTTAVGDVRERFAAATAAYGRAGDLIGLAGALTWYGEQRAVFGWVDEAEEALAEAARIWDQLGEAIGRAEVRAHRARLLLAKGDVASARTAAAAARAVFDAEGAVVLGATAVGIEAAIARVTGPRELAFALTEEALGLLGLLGPTTVVGGLARAELHERFGLPADVVEHATRVLQPMRAPAEATSFGCLAYLALARASARLAEHASACVHLAQATRMARLIASPRLTARTAEVAAEVLAVRGGAGVNVAAQAASWASRRPALDAHLRRDARGRAEVLGSLDADAPPWDDAAALDAIDAAIGGG
jgi:DNA-binding SARP family transcriptional activator/predicted ATPase